VQFGSLDAWVAKYKVGPNGATQVLWKQQLGTSNEDYSSGVATDSQGNIFISGATEGALAGSNKGVSDAWVAKYSPKGALLWKQQLGTSNEDYSSGVATDSQGNVFISGVTEGALAGDNKGRDDAWVAKYSPEGTLLWTKQPGTSKWDESNGVATDSQGNVFISGYTYGALAGSNKGKFDAWVAKYSPTGTLLWRKQLGSSDSDFSFGVATDSQGNVFISGRTYGALAGSYRGRGDAWVAKFRPYGALMWVQQLGTSELDYSNGVATDSRGNVFISGFTEGALKGDYKGGGDAWVAKYSPNGKLWWLRQEGTRSSDYARGVATDSQGNVLVTGYTDGNLGD
jgi:hypothetical protein